MRRERVQIVFRATTARSRGELRRRNWTAKGLTRRMSPRRRCRGRRPWEAKRGRRRGNPSVHPSRSRGRASGTPKPRTQCNAPQMCNYNGGLTAPPSSAKALAMDCAVAWSQSEYASNIAGRTNNVETPSQLEARPWRQRPCVLSHEVSKRIQKSRSWATASCRRLRARWPVLPVMDHYGGPL